MRHGSTRAARSYQPSKRSAKSPAMGSAMSEVWTLTPAYGMAPGMAKDTGEDRPAKKAKAKTGASEAKPPVRVYERPRGGDARMISDLVPETRPRRRSQGRLHSKFGRRPLARDRRRPALPTLHSPR